MIHKAHKIKLNPTKSQKIFFEKSFGVSRFTYNWALNKWREDYVKGIKQSAYSLIKHINSIKRQEFPWMMEVGKTCCQYPIHNVDAAFKKMWKDKKGRISELWAKAGVTRAAPRPSKVSRHRVDFIWRPVFLRAGACVAAS